MKNLRISNNANGTIEEEQNALVPYEAFEPIKKRRPRPKVDLDPETNRIWNLLMGSEGNESAEAMDEDKQKRWEEDRRVFRGRVDSFIARMHLIQGIYIKLLSHQTKPINMPFFCTIQLNNKPAFRSCQVNQSFNCFEKRGGGGTRFFLVLFYRLTSYTSIYKKGKYYYTIIENCRKIERSWIKNSFLVSHDIVTNITDIELLGSKETSSKFHEHP